MTILCLREFGKLFFVKDKNCKAFAQDYICLAIDTIWIEGREYFVYLPILRSNAKRKWRIL
jgi:hypothetical protein